MSNNIEYVYKVGDKVNLKDGYLTLNYIGEIVKVSPKQITVAYSVSERYAKQQARLRWDIYGECWRNTGIELIGPPIKADV